MNARLGARSGKIWVLESCGLYIDPQITRCCLGGSPGAMEALFVVRPGALKTDQGAIVPLSGAFIARPRATKLTRNPVEALFRAIEAHFPAKECCLSISYVSDDSNCFFLFSF
jgi:hypothetical protein